MPWTTGLLIACGAFNIVLGIVGALNKSYISLAAGGSLGLILVVCGLMSRSSPKVAYGIGTAVTLLLLGKFGAEYATKHVFYPAGLIAAGGLVGLIAAIAGLAAKS